jgi:hypothetical protein
VAAKVPVSLLYVRNRLPDEQEVEGVDEDVAEVNVILGMTMIEAELIVMVGAKDRVSAPLAAVRGIKETGARSRCCDTLSSLKDAREALIVAHCSRHMV